MFLAGSVPVMGVRIPRVVAFLMALTISGTVLGAVLGRSGVPLVGWCALIPDLVLRGQVWRLVTWVFFEFSLPPLGLVFSCLGLYFFGADLIYRWGPLGFLWRYLGLTATTGAVTCLLGLASGAVGGEKYFGSAPIIFNGVMIAWAAFAPSGSRILFNFILPLSPRQIVGFTVATDVLGALIIGPVPMVPYLVAVAITLVYMRDPWLRLTWVRLRLLSLGSRRRPPYIKPVERERDRPRWLH